MRIAYEDKIYELKEVITKTNEIDVWKARIITDKEDESKIIKQIQLQKNVNEAFINDEANLLSYLTKQEKSYDMILKLEETFIHSANGVTSLIMVYDNYPIDTDTIDILFGNGDICNYYDFMRIAKTLAKTIYYIHVNGVTHQDICPRNIGYDKETGFIKLLNIRATTSCLTQVFYPRKDLKYIPIEIIESEEVSSFIDRCACDIWSYGLTLFRIANGYDYIGSDTTGGIVKALTQNKFKESRHPNEKINEFLEFVLIKNPKRRPTVYNILAFLERENKIKTIDICPYSDDYVIVNRIVESFNFEIERKTSEELCNMIIEYLMTLYPLETKKTSHDRIEMLSEFFNIQNVNGGASIKLLVDRINNKLASAKQIMSLIYAFKIIEFVMKYHSIKHKYGTEEEYRKQLVSILTECKRSEILQVCDIRTAWSILSINVINNYEMYNINNQIVASIIHFIEQRTI